MLDYVSDGTPMQTPQGAANEQFLNTAPAVGEALSSSASESSLTGGVIRQVERAFAVPQVTPSRGGNAPISSDTPPEQPLPGDEIDKQYAPIGPDGKPASISGGKPMLPSVAKMVSTAKANELDRQGVLSRYANANGAVGSFAVGMAGFMTDPLNIGSLFVPGIGEETALAGIARAGMTTEGLLARTGARAISGASAGVAGQIPLSALHLAIGSQEASDYDARAALKDLAFGAAGGAVIHAGIGGLREAGWIKSDALMRQETPEPIDSRIPLDETGTPAPEIMQQAESVIGADATTKETAMKTAAAQLVTGREVDVDRMFSKNPIDFEALAKDEARANRDGYQPGMTPDELEQATNEAFGVDEENEESPNTAADTPKPAPPSTPPKSLLEFIRDRGGVTDEGGDITSMGGDRAHIDESSGKAIPFQRKLIRSEEKLDNENLLGGGEGTVKSDYHPDNVTQAAHEAGYFPEHGETRPSIHDLYEKIDKELRGDKQYPHHFVEEAAHDPAYMEHLAEHTSLAEQEHIGTSIEEHHQQMLADAERMEKEWLESRGESWEPYDIASRTLEDMEHEHEQANAATGTQHGAGEGTNARNAAADSGSVSEGGRPGTSGSEPDGRTAETTAGSDGGAKVGTDVTAEREPEISAIESRLNTRGMTHEEISELATVNKDYDDAMKALTEKRQALADCLARTGS